jgi:hypothetical protein
MLFRCVIIVEVRSGKSISIFHNFTITNQNIDQSNFTSNGQIASNVINLILNRIGGLDVQNDNKIHPIFLTL